MEYSNSIQSHQIFNDPLRLYNKMLEDIAEAKKSILLETYRFGNDSIGFKFRDALIKKAKQGVRIRLLLDSWGTMLSEHYFKDLIALGAEVRFFKKLKIFFDSFTRNHRRNHRKLLIIDEDISYIGSANIAGHSLHWRELVLRVSGPLSSTFKKSFCDSWELYRKYSFKRFAQKKTLRHKEYELVQDIPSIYRQKIKKRYEDLIRRTINEIIIETPYFLPGFKLRKALMEAAQRGVKVKIVMPLHSDVKLVDILRTKYLGPLHENGVQILFYKPTNLHSKLILCDRELFSIGSTNFDYRSFRYQFELTLIGKEKAIANDLSNRYDLLEKDCEIFNYQEWKNRPLLQRLFEYIFLPFRHLL